MHALNFRKISPIEAISDFVDRVGAGEVEGYRRVSIYGNNPSATADPLNPVDIWYGGGLYPWMTAATSLEIVSSDVLDAGTVVRVALLDIDYNETPMDVVLNGTTPVAIPGQFYRCNGITVLLPASGQLTNVGSLTLRDAGGGTTRAIVPAGRGIARQSAYTVPAGYKLIIRGVHGGVNRDSGASGTRVATISSWLRPFGGAAILMGEQSVTPAWVSHNYPVPAMLPAKTDTVLRAISTSANNLDLTAGIMGYLKPTGSA